MKIAIAVILALVLSIAVAAPATFTDLAPAISVDIVVDAPEGMLKYGEPVTLRCVVDSDIGDYVVQWQRSEDMLEWEDIECNEPEYSFILTEENDDYYYRVIIRCGGISHEGESLRDEKET